MGVWIFMLIMDLLIPFTMIGFARYFMKKAPKEINSVFGLMEQMRKKFYGKYWEKTKEIDILVR